MTRRRVFSFLAAIGCWVVNSGCGPDRASRNSGQTVLPVGAFDTPANGAMLHEKQVFAGWAAHSSGIQSVGIYADGQFIAKADLGIERPDVVKALRTYDRTMVTGWGVVSDVSWLSEGAHVFTAKIRSNAGIERDLSKSANVVR